jgi:hypothetical protein
MALRRRSGEGGKEEMVGREVARKRWYGEDGS